MFAAVYMLAAKFDLGGDGVVLEFPGDPTLVGWAMTCCYFAVALLCWQAMRRPQHELSERPRRLFWMLLMLTLVALGLNKQLDLQTLMTLIGRRVAEYQGWFEERRLVQKIFIAALVALSGTFVAVVIVIARPITKTYFAAIVGLILLLASVALRAAEFERIIETEWMTQAAHFSAWIFQIAGLLGIGLSALLVKSPLGRLPDS